MVKYCRICGLPFEPLKVNQLKCDFAGYGYAILQRNLTQKRLLKKLTVKQARYGQMVQRYKL